MHILRYQVIDVILFSSIFFSLSPVSLGIGMGLSVTPSIMILDWYFEAHQREMVIGLAVSGTSVGTAVMPLLIRKVEEIFGVEGQYI